MGYEELDSGFFWGTLTRTLKYSFANPLTVTSQSSQYYDTDDDGILDSKWAPVFSNPATLSLPQRTLFEAFLATQSNPNNHYQIYITDVISNLTFLTSSLATCLAASAVKSPCLPMVTR